MAAAKLTAIFGSSRRLGRWKIATKSEALVIFGRCHVDFREAYADPDAETISLKIFCLFGSIALVLPEGVSVQPSVVSVLSSSRFEVDATGATSDLPPIELVSTTLFGRCHATTFEVNEEFADPLEEWSLTPADVLNSVAEPLDSSSGLTDPTPMPAMHQRPSLGASTRMGEMETA